MIILDIPRIYYPYSCIICLKSDPNIKRCSKCKLVAYCSKYHQISNWQYSHKHLCKAITACNKKFTPRITTFEEWTNYRLGRQYIWEATLKRNLNSQEALTNQFSPVCTVCYSRENLFCCSNCFNVSYCSRDHQLQHSDEHKRYCEYFKLGLVTDQYVNLNGLTDVEFCPIDKKELSCTKDISKYIKLVDSNPGHNYLTEQQELLALDIIKVERITLGLNLLYALNLSNGTKSKLIIHIIGASDLEAESNWTVITEILLNWLDISHVTYHLIGPDLKSNRKEVYNKFKIVYHSNLYHDIFNKIDKPDLIAAFNCGLHERESERENPWLYSIPKLLHFKRIPLLLTSFTKTELIKDRNIISNLNYKLNVILDVDKNPFAFLKPLRDWLSKDEPIFYRCNYIYIIEKIE